MAEADPQKTFNIHEAKTHLSRLVDRARAGEEIIVAKAGVPCAKLVPIEPVVRPKRKPGGLTVTDKIDWDAFDAPLSEEELELWEGKRSEKHGF
ncbi:type II toxin-antitoxin system Phd/YefM family antitoxin [Sphingomonas bacterium]|uniref:type II toxin-antitoxin system Phd/YefM family antitoxin n=1 Tax=Sphingomonas bacterium TaxID=1895847 RepID=UPI001576545A|nr:type II toxin-antitoxin system prevent-host-death family antitoxin [Sphingomonas bacterium]